MQSMDAAIRGQGWHNATANRAATAEEAIAALHFWCSQAQTNRVAQTDRVAKSQHTSSTDS